MMLNALASTLHNMGDLSTTAVDAPSSDPAEEETNQKHQRFITKDQTLLPGFWRQLYAAIAVSVAAFSSGNVLGWMGPMALKLPSKQTAAKDVSTESLNELLTAMQISSILNMMICGFMMDTMGRRAGCWFLNLFAPAGWVFLSMARNKADIYVGVIMVGATMSSGLVVAEVFITEVCHEKLRGPFLSIVVFSHSCGALFSHILGEFLEYRTFNLCCLVVSLLFPFVFHPLPESPIFLILKSRLVEARTSLEWYLGNDKEAVENEMLNLQNADNKLGNKCKMMISSKADWVSLAVILFMSILSELCGTTVIETYTGVIIKDTIRRPDVAGENALILAFLRFFAGIASVYFVEKAGRKMMLNISLGVMAGSLFFLSSILRLTRHDGKDVWLVTSVLGVYTLANQISLAVMEIICTEIVRPDKRGMFMAIGGTFKILTLIVCLQVYTYLSNKNVYSNYISEASACIVGIVIVKRLIPETQGKTFATIKEEMEDGILPQRRDCALPGRDCFKRRPPTDA